MSEYLRFDPDDPEAPDRGLHLDEDAGVSLKVGEWNEIVTDMFVTDMGLSDLRGMAPTAEDHCSRENPCFSLEYNGGVLGICPVHKTRENTSASGKLNIPVMTHQIGMHSMLIMKRYFRTVHSTVNGITGIWIEEADDMNGPWTSQYAGDEPRAIHHK